MLIRKSKNQERQFVSVDSDKCNGCGLCEYICALEKEGYPNPLLSRIRVVRLNPWINLAVTCRFCEESYCVKACPRDAIKQLETGKIVVDEEKCDACCWCIQACPYGGIVLHPKKRVATCDLCEGEPSCIEFCPENALELVSSDKASEERWISAKNKLASKIEKLRSQLEKGVWTELFANAEERTKRYEEKLEELRKKFKFTE